MSEEHTRDLNDGRSFEDRVFARFDAMEAQFNTRFDRLDGRVQSLDERVQSLEIQAEKRAFETKPIWERALAEILEVKEGLRSLERTVNLLVRDIMTVRADQVRLDDRLDKLDSKPA